jgi:hypothetical protein
MQWRTTTGFIGGEQAGGREEEALSCDRRQTVLSKAFSSSVSGDTVNGMRMKRQIIFKIVILMAAFIPGCAHTDAHYLKARELHTIAGYDEYLKEKPEGRHAKEAVLKRDGLIFGKTEFENSTDGYRKFAYTYPDSQFAEEAVRRAGESDEKRFARALHMGDRRAFSNFVRDYPTSVYVKDAVSRMNWFDQQMAGRNLGVVVVTEDVNDEVVWKQVWSRLERDFEGSGIDLTYLDSSSVSGKSDISLLITVRHTKEMEMGGEGYGHTDYADMGTFIGMQNGAIGGALGAALGMAFMYATDSYPRYYHASAYRVTLTDMDGKELYWTRDMAKIRNPVLQTDALRWAIETQEFPIDSFALLLQEAPPSLGDKAIEEIATEKDEHTDVFLEGLNSENAAVRRFSVRTLVAMGDDRFLEPLIPRLQDADSNVRKEAVRAMGKLGNGEALPHLLSTANDSASDVRLAVATALGEIGDEKAKSTLATLANDDDVYVSLCSIKALGSLGAVEELVPVLRHEDQHVRGNAARILGELGDPKALEPLRGALKDEYDDVRVEASVAIRKIEENQEQISGHQKRP